MKHYSVMLKEIIESLNIKKDGIYVDATLGYGGMSKSILENLSEKGLLIGIDQDEEARNYARELLEKTNKNFLILPINFKDIDTALKENNISLVDGIIFDLGFSSPQIDESSRGFSFMSDAPLDMRMNLENKLTAKYIVNNYQEEKLTTIFFQYGEEKMARVISKGIIKARKNADIVTTKELVEVIKNSVGANYFFKNHPERKIFQALRIEANDELNVLKCALPKAIDLLKKGGRLSVITFHSLEDRIVKQTFKSMSEVPEIIKGMPNIPSMYKPKIKIINKKPITPSEEELKENTRSHSAKLRIIERI